MESIIYITPEQARVTHSKTILIIVAAECMKK